MFRWIPYAMVRITLSFAVGALAGISFPSSIPEKFAAGVFITALAAYVILHFLLKERSGSLFSGTLAMAIIIFAGYWNVVQRAPSVATGHIAVSGKKFDLYIAEIINSPEEKPSVWIVEAKLLRGRLKKNWEVASGNIILQFQKEGLLPLAIGDKIVVSGSPSEIDEPANPFEFNAREYLSYRGITHRQFIAKDQWHLLSKGADHGITYFSRQARTWATRVIRHYVNGSQENVIATALLLGVTEGLETDLRDAYAASGAMHILSVSGLHVGVIYGMILFLLRPLSARAWGKKIVAGVGIVCLWVYALVTGMPPSVLRAVAMFSFIAIGKPFGKETNIYNTLGSSAFILLLVDPFLIMSVGFQLSYLAVLGIAFLYFPIYQACEPKAWIMDKLWQVTSVSLAAQAATFVLGLYYFHQFPVYFLLSNIVVVPLSGLILFVGVVLLVVSPVPVIAGVIGLVLQWLVWILNRFVVEVELLPFSLIEGVQVNGMQCCFLLVLLLALILLPETKKFVFLWIGLVASIWFSWEGWKESPGLNDRQFIIYKIPGTCAIEQFEGCHSYFYSDTVIAEKAIRFHVTPNRIHRRTGKVHTAEPSCIRSFSGFTILMLGKTTILRIEKKDCKLPTGMVVDFLVLGNEPLWRLGSSLDHIVFKSLILDGTNSRAYAARIAREAILKGFSVHSVLAQGAFVIKN